MSHTGIRAALTILAVCLAALALAGCGPSHPPPVGPEALRPTDWDQARPLLDDLDAESLQTAIAQSLRYLHKLPPERSYPIGDDQVTVAGLIAGLEAASALVADYGLSPALFEALRADFALYASPEPVLFTGYYEPLLAGRHQPEGQFATPLYARPRDLVHLDLSDWGLEKKRLTGRVKGRKVVPYPDRAAIDAGAIEDQAEVLAFVDPVEAFFLHIQGSGQVEFPGGERIRVGYATQNGQPYVSLGRVMIERGLMDREGMSLQALKKYLNEHPDDRDELLAANPSYVFFRRLKEGPLGCFGVPVTPGRSLALDRKVYPPAALAFVSTEQPQAAGGEVNGWRPLTRLALIQDTGGAIKGPGRCDIFFGAGPEAELAAGYMKRRGRLFVLIHKNMIN